MKCFVPGLKQTLQWCLEQEEMFTQIDCYKALDVHQATASKRFNRLEQCGILKKHPFFGTNGRMYLYEVADRQLAEQRLNQKPRQSGEYKPVQKPKRTKAIVNSVFMLGAV